MPRKTAEERFWAFVNKGDDDECWLWTGSKNHKGYGLIRIDGKLFLSHRYSFVKHNPYGLSFDDIEGCVVCHECDNPACVNPAHLFVGTMKDNSIDMTIKGRHGQTGSKGEKHWKAKLQDFHIREIRHAYLAGGVTQKQLADEFGVSKTTIGEIVRNKLWTHLTPPSPPQLPSTETVSPHPS